MGEERFSFKDHDGIEIMVHKWSPNEEQPIKGILQIAHGMGEHSLRYRTLASELNQKGYVVYANDHRGHGLTIGEKGKQGYLGRDGFRSLVENLHQLNDRIRVEYPDLPIFLLGHSMGSFIAQQYISRYGESLKGVILSGSNGKQGPILHFGIYLAKKEAEKLGEDAYSPLLEKLSFGSYNKSFRPNRTEYDWLSSQESEVNRYVEDPMCGFVLTAGSFRDFFIGLKEIHSTSSLQFIPKQLPTLLLSGSKDPVGKNGKGVWNLYRLLKKQGLTDLTIKLYPNGRHEMLNETNREEVMNEICNWILERT